MDPFHPICCNLHNLFASTAPNRRDRHNEVVKRIADQLLACCPYINPRMVVTTNLLPRAVKALEVYKAKVEEHGGPAAAPRAMRKRLEALEAEVRGDHSCPTC